MHVLIVDDEKKLGRLLKDGMEEEGCAVTLAYTGTEGLALAQSTPFDRDRAGYHAAGNRRFRSRAAPAQGQ